MIVRILGEGQLEVSDEHVDELNRLDDELSVAIEDADEERFRVALQELVRAVRDVGQAVPDDALVESELVLPGPDASMDDVRALLTDDGLIPG